MKRKIIYIIMLITSITSSLSVVNATSIDVHYDDIKILVNEQEVQTDTSPFIFGGRTFLPIRPVVESLGAQIYWNNETKTVEIYDNRIYELQDLAYGLSMLDAAASSIKDIQTASNDAINYRNDLVANCWSNLDEILAGRITYLDETNEHLEWQIENYIPKLSMYPCTKAVNTDDIKNAFYYCQMAIHNIKLAYDTLKKFDSAKDNSIVLQDYAIYIDKAETYYTDAQNIFLKYGTEILKVIYSY